MTATISREGMLEAVKAALEATELRFPELRLTCAVFRDQVAAAALSDGLLRSLYRQIQQHGGFL